MNFKRSVNTINNIKKVIKILLLNQSLTNLIIMILRKSQEKNIKITR